MRVVDLRSDTITKPTPSMRQAMAEAEVGDDVFGEDPTVNRLENLASELLGKEAALLTVSGTMSNLISVMTHCRRGDEIILGDQSHLFLNEQGGCAAIGGIHPRIIPNQPDGSLKMEDIEAAIRTDNIHFPRTRLIVLENTHNRCNGNALSVDYMKKAGILARKYNLSIHVDGARIFNAAAALQVKASDLAKDADSVSFCLSKGLAAPVGSLICGTTAFIAEARRVRKVIGGGMRQAGVLAAAGIIALTEMTTRLSQDHENARRLAEGIAQCRSFSANPESVQTNIVYITLKNPNTQAKTAVSLLEKQGVRVLATGPSMMRAVTHYHITSDDIDHAVRVLSESAL